MLSVNPTRMTLQEYRDTDEPVHLAEVLVYRIDSDYDGVCVREYKYTFYKERVRWVDHPWSRHAGGRPGGADFLNHWTVESRRLGEEHWDDTGRTGDGWRAVLEMNPQWYGTAREALKDAIKRAKEQAESAVKRWQRAVENFERLTSEMAALA